MHEHLLLTYIQCNRKCYKGSVGNREVVYAMDHTNPQTRRHTDDRSAAQPAAHMEARNRPFVPTRTRARGPLRQAKRYHQLPSAPVQSIRDLCHPKKVGSPSSSFPVSGFSLLALPPSPFRRFLVLPLWQTERISLVLSLGLACFRLAGGGLERLPPWPKAACHGLCKHCRPHPYYGGPHHQGRVPRPGTPKSRTAGNGNPRRHMQSCLVAAKHPTHPGHTHWIPTSQTALWKRTCQSPEIFHHPRAQTSAARASHLYQTFSRPQPPRRQQMGPDRRLHRP